jgi:Tripartite tricarboxylate transporter TctB family
MRATSHRDLVSGLLFVVLGAAFAIGATKYGLGSGARPGPGYFPLILGGLLATLGLIVAVRSQTAGPEPAEPIGHLAWKPLLATIASIIVFGVALPRLGLVITVPIVVLIVSVAGHEFSWKSALTCGAILALGSWLIFIVGLELTIPLTPGFLVH